MSPVSQNSLALVLVVVRLEFMKVIFDTEGSQEHLPFYFEKARNTPPRSGAPQLCQATTQNLRFQMCLCLRILSAVYSKFPSHLSKPVLYIYVSKT